MIRMWRWHLETIAVVACVLTCSVPAASSDVPGWILGKRSSEPNAASASERKQAALLLGRYGPRVEAVAELVRALSRESDPSVRQSILEALARRADGAAVPALVEVLRGGSPPERESAAVALAAIGTDEAIEGLLEALGHVESLAAARRGVERLGPSAHEAMIAALSRPEARDVAAAWLGASKRKAAVPALLSALKTTPSGELSPILRALGAIGDRSASEAVALELMSSSSVVVEAALEALRTVGTPAQAPDVIAKLADPRHAKSAFQALVAIDPAAAARSLAAIRRQDVTTFLTLGPLVAEGDHPALAPALALLTGFDATAPRALEGLAHLSRGAGVPRLLVLSAQRPALRRPVEVALAVALRRWGPALAPAVRGEAFRTLSASSSSERREMLLRALARDDRVASILSSKLASSDPRWRATAALGLTWLDHRAATSALEHSLPRETSPATWRRIAAALVHFEAAVPLASLVAHLETPAEAPEALSLAGYALRGRLTSHVARPIREQLRRALRDPIAAVRTAAAEALSLAGDEAALPALIVTLDDPSLEVRWAALRALERLAHPPSASTVASRAPFEPDASLRRALRRGAERIRRGVRHVPTPEDPVERGRFLLGRGHPVAQTLEDP